MGTQQADIRSLKWEAAQTAGFVELAGAQVMMAHFAVRGLMHETPMKASIDPDALSFIHAVRVIRRTLPHLAALPSPGPGRSPRKRAPGTAG